MDTKCEESKIEKKNLEFNTIGQCDCNRDVLLPCCEKAAKWIKLIYRNKGKRFNYEMYKNKYKVIFF